jgi:excisionase family DNA binding protein
MSDTARDYKINNLASTEGLDEFFEPLATLGQSTPDLAIATPDQTQATPDHAGLAIEQAAKILGVSNRTILRRLQKKTLDGFKINGPFGPEWRVSKKALTTHSQTLITLGLATPDLAIATPVQPQTSPVHLIFQDIEEEESEREQPDSANSQTLTTTNIDIADLLLKLEGASYRIGYLESKLEEKNSQIKLLTDSQHKPSWWAKFSSWFFKGQ